MKIFSSAIHLIWLIVLAIFSLASPIAVSGFSSVPVLFAYDGQNQVRMAYDGGFPSEWLIVAEGVDFGCGLLLSRLLLSEC